MMVADYYGCANCGGDGWLDERSYCNCELGQDMEHAAMATIYTTQQIATELGISSRRVRKIADRENIGHKLNDRVRVFTAADLAWFRTRNTTPGRPRKHGT